jgi:hypothetical protein
LIRWRVSADSSQGTGKANPKLVLKLPWGPTQVTKLGWSLPFFF